MLAYVLGVLGVVVLLGVGGEADEPCSFSFSLSSSTLVDDTAFGNLYAEQLCLLEWVGMDMEWVGVCGGWGGVWMGGVDGVGREWGG